MEQQKEGNTGGGGVERYKKIYLRVESHQELESCGFAKGARGRITRGVLEGRLSPNLIRDDIWKLKTIAVEIF